MLANEFNSDTVTPSEWRVLDRIGARDPAGIKRAMKQYNVNTIDELVSYLEHHQPKRKPLYKLRMALSRLASGSTKQPHYDDIKQAFKTQPYEITQRMKQVKKTYDR